MTPKLFPFFQTFTYQDEHSAPFSWRTRSQQDLAFEYGRPPSMTSDDLNENGLEVITASPSKILTRNTSSHLARYSKGNPSFAKAVQIPTVPNIPKPDLKPNEASVVPPEQINNFVYESSPNRIVLDFGELTLEQNQEETNSTYAESNISFQTRTDSPASDSSRSTKSLISKVKRTLTNPNGVVSTLRRRSHNNNNASNDHNLAEMKSATLDSRREVNRLEKQRHSVPSSANLVERKAIVKPTVAPPPPPSRPVRPPPPPVRTISQISSTSATKDKDVLEQNNVEEDEGVAMDSSSPESKSCNQDSGELEDFKIDLATESKEMVSTMPAYL